MACRFVVTQHGEDYGYDFCHGVYEDEEKALGVVLKSMLDAMEDGKNKEIRVQSYYDSVGGDFYDVTCIQPENADHSELKDVYRVYFLRDKEEE